MHVKLLGPARYKLNNLLISGGKYVYMKNDKNETPLLRLIRAKMIDSLIRNFVIVLSMATLAMGMLGIHSAYLILIKGVRITSFSTELPFVDNDSDFGYWLIILIQSLTAAVGFIGCLLIETGHCLIINVVTAVPYLIHVDLEALNTELYSNGLSLAVKARLQNVVMKILDKEKYSYHSII